MTIKPGPKPSNDSAKHGLGRTITFTPNLMNAINQYRTMIFDKTSFKPSFNGIVRALCKEALINRKAFDESELDEEDGDA